MPGGRDDRAQRRCGVVEAHSEYADGRAGSFDVGVAPPGARQLFFTEWLARVRLLFDATLVDKLTTRTVVWGLALLDHDLGDRLRRDGFLVAFRAHRTEQILAPEGRRLLLRAEVRPGTAIMSDAWTARDRLEYELYADAIAALILLGRREDVADEDGPAAHGPARGSGAAWG